MQVLIDRIKNFLNKKCMGRVFYGFEITGLANLDIQDGIASCGIKCYPV